jgi:hypothetical protein
MLLTLSVLLLLLLPLPALAQTSGPQPGVNYGLRQPILTKLVNRADISPCLREPGGYHQVSAPVDSNGLLHVRYYQPPTVTAAKPCPSRVTLCAVRIEDWEDYVERPAMPTPLIADSDEEAAPRRPESPERDPERPIQ